MIAQFYPADPKDKSINSSRSKYYKTHVDKFDMTNIEYPVKLSDIAKVRLFNSNWSWNLRVYIWLVMFFMKRIFTKSTLMSNFQIERRNNLSINVFTWDVNEDSLIPCYHGSESGRNVDLLLFINGDERHYILIKSFGAVMR